MTEATATENELFDAAMVRFLTERAASQREVDWRVDYDGDTEWEVRLWLAGVFQGRFRVTAAGSELLPEG